MTVVPDNLVAIKKDAEVTSKQKWKTPKGWSFPGKKTMVESNVHPLKPDIARTQYLITVSIKESDPIGRKASSMKLVYTVCY